MLSGGGGVDGYERGVFMPLVGYRGVADSGLCVGMGRWRGAGIECVMFDVR